VDGHQVLYPSLNPLSASHHLQLLLPRLQNLAVLPVAQQRALEAAAAAAQVLYHHHHQVMLALPVFQLHMLPQDLPVLQESPLSWHYKVKS